MKPILRNAYSTEYFRESAHRVVDLLADHLEASLSGQQAQSIPWIEPEQSVDHWRAIAERETSIEEICQEVANRSVRISDPKFMGHQVCTPAPTAMIAGLLTDCMNNGSGIYEMALAGTAMEKYVIRTVTAQLGMPETADGIMTSGGTLANLTGLLAARSVKSGNDWADGTKQQLAIIVSDQSHYCIDRAVRIMGWGKAGMIRVPTDERFAMQVSELQRLYDLALDRGCKVIAVVGSACSTSTGSFDDLRAIGEFCRSHDLWFHVDGAHGAAVAFSRTHRHLVQGIELADSVVLDFHKMMMVPVISSALLFRRKADSFRSFSVEADYLFANDSEHDDLNEFDLAKRTFECTKSMLSAKVFSLLAVHGVELFEANVDHLHDLARIFANMLEDHSQFELAVEPQTNIVCFRYLAESNSSEERSTINAQIREKLTREGHFYIVKTVLNGETWLRCTITNPFTTKLEMSALLDAVLTC